MNELKKLRISVIGLGFVGLSLAVTNAKKGFTTIGVDIEDKKISRLKKGNPYFFEPSLTNYLKSSLKSGKIQFTTEVKKAILETDITFLTVGTPLLSSGKIDLSYVKKASKEIKSILISKKKFHLVVIKSTLPPLTTNNVIFPIFKNLINKKKMSLLVNPEFLSEGYAIKDILDPHLIVIGEQDKKSGNILEKYYKDFYKITPEIIRTSFSTAELIKYANNAFLATKISFINSMANLCQKIPNSDVNTISYAIGKDVRIGPLFLQAGPGFGGSCLPKDLTGIINFSKNLKIKNNFFQAVKEVNELQPKKIIELMKKMNVYNKRKVIAILGLAFKKDTDDIREAVSGKLIKKIISSGLNVKVHDPMAMNNFKKKFGDKITYCEKIKNCLENTDCCVILTEWDIYRNLNQKDFIKYMKIPNVIDARRILDPNKFTKINFVAIGRGK